VAEFFLSPNFCPIAEAERTLELTRSGVLSHLHCINEEHGIGYEVTSDGLSARLVVPLGYDPFAEADGGRTSSRGLSGKPMEPERFKPVKVGSKRGEVATKFEESRRTVDSVAEEMDLTRSGVLSHLHSLWKFHAVGYSVEADGTVVLLYPKGQRLFEVEEPEVADADDWG
jgi:hypothetical protein